MAKIDLSYKIIFVLSPKLEAAQQRLKRLSLRPARPGDVPQLAGIINHFSKQSLLNPVSEAELYDDIAKFIVADDSRHIVGCVSLTAYTPHLGEIKSLAVIEELQGLGLGEELLDAALQVATGLLHLKDIFAVSHNREFFRKLGFAAVEPTAITSAVWKQREKRDGLLNPNKIVFFRKLESKGALWNGR